VLLEIHHGLHSRLMSLHWMTIAIWKVRSSPEVARSSAKDMIVIRRIKECKTDQAGGDCCCLLYTHCCCCWCQSRIGKQSRLLALNEGIEINARGAANEV
jgi:hypothetical protein